MSLHTLHLVPPIQPYYRHAPHALEPVGSVRRYVRLMALGAASMAGVFCVLNSMAAVLQFNRMPLFVRAGNTSLSLATLPDAESRLAQIPVPSLSLTIGSATHTAPPAKIGLTVDVQATLRAIETEKRWKAVPLVAAYYNAQSPARVVYSADKQKTTAYLQTIAPAQNKPPVDAAIVIPPQIDKQAYIVSEHAGMHFDVQRAYQQIASELRQHERLEIVLTPQSVQPKVRTAQLATPLERTNRLLGARLALTGGGATYELAARHTRSLVRLTPNSQGIPTPTIDRGALVGLLKEVSGTFSKAPSPTVVMRINGRTAGTTQGTAGHALNVEATADVVMSALQEERARQEVVLTALPPSVVYKSSYSPTSEGLQALIQDFASSHRGSYYVVARELSGERAAYYNHHTSVVPASIFKVFLAYVALHKIEQGQLQFSTQTSAGSVEHCIQQMIVISTDKCAIAIMDHIGRAEIDAVIHAAGFGGTSLNNAAGEHKHSTANDIANILTGLHSGSLLSRTNSDYLLGLMRQQIYRRGIPAGSAGAPVADKVGVLYSWTHDAGIVYAPKSTYVLVVMTANGGGYPAISELARSVYDLLNQ